jgi:hypothetical protein
LCHTTASHGAPARSLIGSLNSQKIEEFHEDRLVHHQPINTMPPKVKVSCKKENDQIVVQKTSVVSKAEIANKKKAVKDAMKAAEQAQINARKAQNS